MRKTFIYAGLLLQLYCPGVQAEDTKESYSFKKEEYGPEISDFEARLEYARLLGVTKNYKAALEEFEKLLKENPSSVPVKVEIAKIYYYQKQYDQAIMIIRQVPLDKLDSESEMLLGDIYLSKKDYMPAEDIFRGLLQKDPGNLPARYKLAELYSWQKKYDDSIHEYQILLKKLPNDIQIRRKYGMVLMWMGNYPEAAKQLEQTLPENAHLQPNPAPVKMENEK